MASFEKMQALKKELQGVLDKYDAYIVIGEHSYPYENDTYHHIELVIDNNYLERWD